MFKNKRKSQNYQDKPREKTATLSKKEIAAQKRKITQKRTEFVQTIVICGVVSLAVTTALFFVASAKIAIAGG
ncbi:MAG TPA: hypothetical protein DCS91_22510, partial [Microcoleaceae bacterium UBA11344]|nr:hypothetical protein [Microcoleaceae cyanobacterium UBA11344]